MVHKEEVNVFYHNEAHFMVGAEHHVLKDIKNHFTFEVPNARFHPKVKARMWDGKISLLGKGNLMYYGLLPRLKKFCEENDYELCIQEEVITKEDITPAQMREYVDSLNIHSLGNPVEVRDYQLAAIYASVLARRRTLLSPTSSGKSLIIYCIIRWLLEHNKKILLIVPNIGLVRQMFGDFDDYSSHNGFDVGEHTQTISEGSSKVIEAPIVLSTWQSIYKLPAKWFNHFDAILVDEVHLAQANSLRGIMEKATDVQYRIGLTGTLSEAKTHELVITGLFGATTQVAETADLIEKGYISDIQINCVLLQYHDKEEIMMVRESDYQGELEYITTHEKRARVVAKLAMSCKGNVLILINFIEHGEMLMRVLEAENAKRDKPRKLFFIHGKVDGDTRDEIRGTVDKEDDAILIATFGTTSTGTNIRRIHHIIAASPTKSLIRLLQSIGRGLRKAHDKDKFTWWDIVDDFTGGKTTKSARNFCFEHFVERLRIYTKQKFTYKLMKLKI